MLVYILLLSFVLFLTLIFLALIIKLGGSTMWQIIKSKLPGFKHKGMWVIQAAHNQKIKFVYMPKVPKNYKIKIKSGEKPHQDEYASINDIYHQHDQQGTPVIMTIEDLPFTFFLKKHFLDNWFTKIQDMIDVCRLVIEKKKFQDAAEVKIMVQQFVESLKPHVKYIPGACEKIEKIINIDSNQKFKDKPPIVLLTEFHDLLYGIKENIMQKNRQFVNVHDLFKTTGTIRAIQNAIVEAFHNGVLYMQQKLDSNKTDKLLFIFIIIIGVIGLISGYMTYNTMNTVSELQTQVSAQQVKINEITNTFLPIAQDIEGASPTPPLSPNS